MRIPPASIDPSIKNYHWLDLVRGLYDAYDRGAETALILDFNGNVAEGPGFNVFCVKDGRLSTPAVGVLPGITRRTVFDLCAEAGLSAAQADVGVAALKAADEVFITSTAGGIMDDEVAVRLLQQRLAGDLAARIFRVDPGIEAGDQLLICDDGFGDFSADAADDDAMHFQPVPCAGVEGLMWARIRPAATLVAFGRFMPA